MPCWRLPTSYEWRIVPWRRGLLLHSISKPPKFRGFAISLLVPNCRRPTAGIRNMNSSHIYSAVICFSAEPPNIVEGLFRFRKTLFVDDYGWSLLVEDDRERDRFETEQAVSRAIYRRGDLIGGFRVLRIDQPCLARLVSSAGFVREIPERSDDGRTNPSFRPTHPRRRRRNSPH